MPDEAWIIELASRLGRGESAVLVTMARASGSTPREAGAAMLVGTQDVFGTIGGGHLEFEAIRLARNALLQSSAPAPWLVRFPLAASLGQCCGGVATLAFAVIGARDRAWVERAAQCMREGAALQLVTRIGAGGDSHTIERNPDAIDSDALLAQTGDGATLLVHTVVPSDFNVLVFGNGHVGRALAQVLGALPARVRWVDGREEDFPAHVAGNVEIVVTDVPEAELRAAPAGAFVIVTTHDHALDLGLIETALARDDWRYLGLIGSTSKRNQFERRLLARGFSPQQVARITCPIGRGHGLSIRSKAPGAIAVAVAAEILALRESALNRVSLELEAPLPAIRV